MRGLKLTEWFKSTQVYDINNSSETNGGGSTSRRRTRSKVSSSGIISFVSKSKPTNKTTSEVASSVVPLQLPSTDTLEPFIEPFLKPVNLVESLAELYQRLECCSESKRASLCVEQYSLLRSLGDQKLLRRCLRTARQNAEDVLSKIVLSAWLRFERREDELEGVSSMECGGCILECPKLNLVHGFSPFSVNDRCQCPQDSIEGTSNESSLSLPDEERMFLSALEMRKSVVLSGESQHYLTLLRPCFMVALLNPN